MKASTLFFYLLVFSLFSCSGERKHAKTALEQMNLKGSVKSIKQTVYPIGNDGKPSKTPTLISQLSFSKKGHLMISHNKFYPPGMDRWIWYSKTYNDYGDVTEESGNDGSSTILHTYEYDNHGQKTKEIIQQKGINSPNKKILYTYNADGLLVKATCKDHDVTFTREFFYDENGNNIKQVISKNGKKVTTAIFKYNDHNYITSLSYETAKGSYSRKLVLNKNGDIVKESSSGQSKENKFYLEFEDFQPFGFRLEKQKATATYTYDSKKNWIIKKSVQNTDNGKYLEKREISYY